MIIRLAAPDDFEAVSDLRLAAYRAAPQFVIADEKAVTRWDGPVFLAELPEVGLVATMQAVLCESITDLQRANGNEPPPDYFSAYPTLLLNRGATKPGRHQQGLNSHLRLAALEMALKDERIQSLTGFVYDGAPRLNVLRNLGYVFTPVESTDEDFISHAAEFFVCLSRSQFLDARDKLLAQISL